MMIFRAAFLFVMMGASAAFADVELYLYPRVERGEADLLVSDIARIQADAETVLTVGAVAIDRVLHSDGYLDRSDIARALRESGAGRIRIHGGGVRVIARDAGEGTRPAVAVQKGAAIRFQVVTGSVRVETTGIAMRDGAAGEVIPVQLKGKTVSRGRVVNDKVVELAL